MVIHDTNVLIVLSPGVIKQYKTHIQLLRHEHGNSKQSIPLYTTEKESMCTKKEGYRISVPV